VGVLPTGDNYNTCVQNIPLSKANEPNSNLKSVNFLTFEEAKNTNNSDMYCINDSQKTAMQESKVRMFM
jgi:hypothetical protein